MYSSMGDQSDTLTLLIKRGALLAIQDNYGQTSLHWAAITGSYKCLRVLLAKATEVHIKDNDGRYAHAHTHTHTHTHTHIHTADSSWVVLECHCHQLDLDMVLYC